MPVFFFIHFNGLQIVFSRISFLKNTLQTVRAADGTCTELRALSAVEDRFTGVFDNLLDNKRRAN